jgi:hypothetical protein
MGEKGKGKSVLWGSKSPGVKDGGKGNGRKSLGKVSSMRRGGIEEVSKSRRIVFFSVTQNVMG